MAPSKKRPRETLDSVLARPWCYYCDRDFDDLKILHDHQKAKHFHCTVYSCNRRLNTAGGLRVHLQQVHKEELPAVPNAMDGREDPNVEIFGLEGVPQGLIDARISYVTRRYNRMEADHRQRTGNPLPGGMHENKRPKMESKEELKARVATLKAKKAAEKAAQAAGGPLLSNGNNATCGQDSPHAFSQDTPTPPGAQGFGVPPAFQPTPPGVQAYGIPPTFQPTRPFADSPVSSTFNHLPPGVPIASFSQAPGFGHGAPPMSSSSPLPVKPSNTLPLPPYSNSPSLPSRPDYSRAPLGASNPSGYTPHGRGIPAPALGHHADHDALHNLPPMATPVAEPILNSQDFENLLDWASQNPKQGGEQLPASTSHTTTQPHVTRSEELSKWEAYQRNLAESEEPQQTVSTKQDNTAAASKILRVPGVASTPKSEVKPDSRNKQLLNNNLVSWEEKKAQNPRYTTKKKSTTGPTVTGTPGATEPLA